MPMGPAELTLAKLNSVLGGKGGEWGSEEGPTGALVSAEVRGRARQLGNSGQTAAAAELLLQAALQSRIALPPQLLAEIEQNIAPTSPNAAGLRNTIAGLRSVAASGSRPGGGVKKSFFSKLFGR